jgi:hypothetical protein
MNKLCNKQVIVGVVLIALFISIPLTISVLSKQQNDSSHAAASTSLSFTPTSSSTTPIQANIGDAINLDLYVNPGTNLVTFVKYQISFDSSKIKLVTSNPFDLNSTVFTSVEGPVINSGTFAQSVSIGSDPTKVITTPTKIGTLHFTAVSGTNGGTTSVSFGTITQALSSNSNTQASENVLSTTSPALISINGTASPSATAQPLPTITGTALSFTLLLDGVGSAGDNPNPNGNSLSNKNPLHPQRNLNVQVFDTNNNIVASSSAPVTFDSGTGTFLGSVGLPASVPSGNYYIKVQTERYLRKLMPGITQLVAGQTIQVPSARLITGDTNNDNVLNVLDYNALLDCGYGEINPLPINDPNSTFNSSVCQVHQPAIDIDLNDDGIVDSTDYNLFLRELSVQNGD